jgi:hypothetical protein
MSNVKLEIQPEYEILIRNTKTGQAWKFQAEDKLINIERKVWHVYSYDDNESKVAIPSEYTKIALEFGNKLTSGCFIGGKDDVETLVMCPIEQQLKMFQNMVYNKKLKLLEKLPITNEEYVQANK